MPHGGGSNEQTTRDPSEAAAEATGQPESVGGAPAADGLEAKLVELEAQIAQLKEERLRALAEVENVRRRAARDRRDASQYAITGFARDILSVADNLQRALGSVDAEARSQDPALDALMNGLEMTERELHSVLGRYGVTAIEADGLPFDPHVHEAMFEIPNESVAHGTVLQVLQRGYRLHDRTLRPARVGISRGGPKLQPGAAEASAAPDAAAAAERPAAPPVEESPVQAPPEAATETAPGGGDETVIDFRKRATAEPYPKQPGGDPRSGSRFDETL